MRILYHHRTLADGAEGIHIAEMVNAFRHLHHRVHVKGLASPTVDGVPRAGGLSRIRAILPEVVLEAASLAYNVPEWLELARDIEQFKPDVMYKRHARFDIAPLLIARRKGIPTILEVNAVYSARPYCDFEPLVLRGLAERMERRAFDLATVVVAVSTPMARQVRALTAGHVVVLTNAADPNRFDERLANPERVKTRLGLDSRLTVGWTGILRDWHGLELLLEAVRTLPDAQILIVGDGPARAALKERAAAAGVAERLIITGRVSHAEMPDFIAAMDVAVVADERTGVASPMKLLEYMAMGRAVVAPRLESISDIVTHEVNGLLFEPGDTRQLAGVLLRLASNGSLRAALGRQARTDVERRWNWRRNAERTLELVREAQRTPITGVAHDSAKR